jgi:hypothetical protein
MTSASLEYLGLPQDYNPSPSSSPIQFLEQHLHTLPPHVVCSEFASVSPQQRTSVRTIRNRRLKYTQSHPTALEFSEAKSTWPLLWRGPPTRPGEDQRAAGNDERRWVENEFIGGWKPHVRKLGELLAGYEEEREGERERMYRRQRAQDDIEPEEDSDSDDEDEGEDDPPAPDEQETFEEAKETFLRLINERLIYGKLDVSPESIHSTVG